MATGERKTDRRREVPWGSVRKVTSGYQARLPPSVDPGRRPLEGGPFRTEALAKTALHRARLDWEDGRAVDPGTARQVRTVDDAVGRYLESIGAAGASGERSGLAPNTIRDYGYLRRRVIGADGWGIADKRLRGPGAVGRAAVRTWLTAATRHLSRNTARKALVLLTAALADAARDNLVGSNPADGVTMRGRGPQRAAPGEKHFFLAGEEVVALAAERDGVQYPLLIACILWGGLRGQEVRALRPDDVLVRRSALRVDEAVSESGGLVIREAKSSRSRTVRVPRGLTDLLTAFISERHIGPTDLLFPRGRTRASTATLPLYDAGLIKHTWSPAVRASEVTGDAHAESPARRRSPTPHDGRSTHASWLYALGWGPAETRAQLGHSTIMVTMDLYTEIQAADVRDADAARLAADADLLPGERLDLLWEGWHKRYAGLPAPAWDAWLAGRYQPSAE